MLLALRSEDLHRRADCVAIAFVTHQIQSEPMILRAGFVMQNVHWTTVLRDHSVEPAIVVDIPDGHPAACPGLVKHWARLA